MTFKTEHYVINIGPQHPSTHGVFRLRLTLDGEVIVDVEPIFGYLHRGMEKLAEGRNYTKNIPLTDRLDYLASMINNQGYCMAVEDLLKIEVPERAQYIRVIMAELQRIGAHLAGIGFFLNDIGAFMTPLLYMFREREKIVELFDMVCGQRLNYNYMRFGGVAMDLPDEFLPALKKLLNELPGFINEYDQLITTNEIVLVRSKGVGILPREMAVNTSAAGPVLRGSGVKWDLRKNRPYSIYDRFEFDIPVGEHGDTYDRYLVRMEEMRQSVRILKQAAAQIPEGEYMGKVSKLIRPPAGETYTAVEGAKGELGFYIIADGSENPYRWHVRAPSLINLTALREMLIGWKVADLMAIFGSIDIVMGEVDR
ncbi:MAG: NADH-quinone oxidoreductase subunit D [Dehalogenimonas sp.]|uniref:NADH-quinone oxidoreductase subunit D n=1 Tax=Candidatus Dehalogenimonas loeffleri TaxID=3127115 RepID=A0ABZ2J806_9CHLR|nr:NADH-quinone oxidoreductase subunit D [Dehalogenimonas sp.]